MANKTLAKDEALLGWLSNQREKYKVVFLSIALYVIYINLRSCNAS